MYGVNVDGQVDFSMAGRMDVVTGRSVGPARAVVSIPWAGGSSFCHSLNSTGPADSPRWTDTVAGTGHSAWAVADCIAGTVAGST